MSFSVHNKVEMTLMHIISFICPTALIFALLANTLLDRTIKIMLYFLLQGIEEVIGATDNCIFTVSNYATATSDPENGNDQDQFACCVNNSCTFYSFEDALTNVTNNVIIDIKTSIEVTSTIYVENVNNILIRSQSNVLVLCANTGGLRFVSCSNITIKGIILQGCGGLWFNNSSNITIQDCSFHNSTGQAVVISGKLRDVCIKDCQFTHNNNYSGLGSAIWYLSGTVDNPPAVLNINNCNFTSNGPAESVVYICSSTSNVHQIVLLQDSVFISNQGVPIFLSNAHINVLGTMLVRQNTANSGGGVYSTDSIIEFCDCSVQFYDNSVTASGGAVYLYNSDLIFGFNTSAQFENNDASRPGGGIFSEVGSLITFGNNSVITFTNNSARIEAFGGSGGAIHATIHTDILFTDNSLVTFNSNKAGYFGGAITAHNSSNIKLDGNCTVRFNSNSFGERRWRGGAIVIVDFSHMLFNENCMVDFNGNYGGTGGAIRSHNSEIFINGNSVVKFCNNKASFQGGAISLEGGHSGFSVNGTSTVIFENNTAYNAGGAIYAYRIANISFGGNAVLKFAHNSAAVGGVFYVRSDILCHKNSTVTFIDNHAIREGGAVYILQSAILFGDNSIVTFSRNTANEGGAVYASNNLWMLLNGKTRVTFVNNTATTRGGAVYVRDSNILFNTPLIFFWDNSAQYGPAVYCDGDSSLRFDRALANYTFEDGENLYVGSNCNVSAEKYTCEYK